MKSKSLTKFILLAFLATTSIVNAQVNSELTTTNETYNYQQADKHFKEADKLLNDVYDQIMTGTFINIEDKLGKKMLRESEVAWIKFRDANCNMYSKVRGIDDFLKQTYLIMCEAELTENRINDLRVLLNKAIRLSDKSFINEIRRMIAEDILSRMEPDFYFYNEKSLNIEKLTADCNFKEVDLNDDGKLETIVKLNWFSDGSKGISAGHNYVRGAHDSGAWYIYNVTNGQINYIGTLEGDRWQTLSTKSAGFKDIETWSHDSYKDYLINTYKYSKGKYSAVSSILYELNEDGSKKAVKKVYK